MQDACIHPFCILHSPILQDCNMLNWVHFAFCSLRVPSRRMQDACMMRDGCKMRAFCILRACRAVQGCTHFAFCILRDAFLQYALSSPRAFCILQGLQLPSCKMRASTHFACLRKNARCTHFAFCIWCLSHAAARAGFNGRRDIL